MSRSVSAYTPDGRRCSTSGVRSISQRKRDWLAAVPSVVGTLSQVRILRKLSPIHSLSPATKRAEGKDTLPGLGVAGLTLAGIDVCPRTKSAGFPETVGMAFQARTRMESEMNNAVPLVASA